MTAFDLQHRRAAVDPWSARVTRMAGIAQFSRDTMKEDSARATRAHEPLKNITGAEQADPAARVRP